MAGDSVTVEPHKTAMIHTGIAMEIPEGYAGLIFARSGLACKRGLAPANKVGVIDADYRGEIIVALHNHTDSPVTVEGGERVAQISLVPFLKAEYTLSDELSDTVRGAGGFGSTGKK
jgi:dUTP pyrophosphatase